MKIFSGTSNKPLAEKIARSLEIQLSPLEVHIFPDGERRVRVEADVVDQDVVIVQSTSTPVDQNYMELFFLIDAAKRNGASFVTVVVPYIGYQRQDHIFRSGEAVSMEVIARILDSLGVGKIIALDLHTIKIPEFFSIPFEEVSALPIFAEFIRGLGVENSVLVSPDMGGQRRINILSELLEGMPYIATVKDRDLQSGTIQMSGIEGILPKDTKKAFIVDDMISSGNTIVQSANLLKSLGIEQIYVFATHVIFSDHAPTHLQESLVQRVYVTDSVFIPKEKKFEKLEVFSVAALIAQHLK